MIEQLLATAGGVLLAFYVLRLVDYIKDAPQRRHQREMARAVSGAVDAFMDHLQSPEHQEHIKQAGKKPARRKPATKKAPAKKKTVTAPKKGATNVKAKARR